MRKRMLLGLLTGLLAFGGSSYDLTVSAEGETQVFNVADFGANGADKEDDSEAINKALKMATEIEGPIQVYIPGGTYYINQTLRYFSNTTLTLATDATIVSTDEALGTMLRGQHLKEDGSYCYPEEECPHGNYTQVQNVVIEGGTWNRNDTGGEHNGIIRINHGENVIVRDTTLKNCTDHFINSSGSQNVTIERVNFYNAVVYNGQDMSYWGEYAPGDTERLNIIEAIHLDYSNALGENVGWPFDNTPTKNITVQNCVFKNVFCAVGNHHIYNLKTADGIVIANNTFNNLKGYAIDAYDFGGMTVTDNNTIGGLGLIRSKNSISTVTGNTATNCTSNVISISDNSEMTANSNIIKGVETIGAALRSDGANILKADNNQISTITGYGIYVTDGTKAELTNNTISKVGTTGIRVDASTVIADGNIITSPATHGISVSTNATLTGKKNNIKNPGENGIHLADGSEATLESCKVSNAIGDGYRAADTGNLTLKKCSAIASGNNGISGASGTLTIDGCTITGAKANAVYAESQATVKVTNSTISDTINSAIKAGGNSKVTATGNTISNTAADVMSVKDHSTLIAKKNNITASSAHVFYVSDSTNATLESNILSDIGGSAVLAKTQGKVIVKSNTISNVQAAAISCSDKVELTSSGNTITTVTGNGIYSKDSTTIVTDCTLDGVDAAGVRGDGSALTVTGTEILNPKTHGISVTGGTLTASSNTITSPGGNGVVVEKNANAELNENTISGCGNVGIKCSGSTVKAQKNKISNTTSHGISDVDGGDLNAISNILENILGNGFHISGSSKGRIVSNTLKSITGNGIRANDKSVLNASKNTIGTVSGVGINVADSTNCNLKDNKITKIEKVGIYLLSVTNCVISGNEVTETGDHAIGVNAVENSKSTVTIQNNIFSTNSSTAFDIRLSNYCVDCVLKDNTMKNTGFKAGATCSFTQQDTAYKVNYVLNGGTNHAKNVTTYTMNSGPHTLEKPTKSGAVFEGWYEDEKCTKPVTVIAKGTTGDLTFYAKWTQEARKLAATAFKVVGVIGGRNVTFSSTDSDAVIYYSTTTSTLTTKDKKVANGGTILFENYYGTLYARAYVDGRWSNVSRLILKIPVVNTPTVTDLGNGYVKITTTTPKCGLYYTVDGTTPSVKNGRYIGVPSTRVYVGRAKTVKAIAVRSCFTTSKMGLGSTK